MEIQFENKGIKPANSLLKTIECLGSAAEFIEQIYLMIGHSKFFSDFTRENIQQMSSFMNVYKADAGEMIIREGDVDDYMLLVMEGRINIVKMDSHGERRPMTIVGPGSILGEMSMIDGEPRFASCIALETTVFAVLSRDDMVRVIMEEPTLGSKILIKLVTLMSGRLRETSNSLLRYLERTDAV